MKNLVKLLPLLATMALVSCKKDQTADQLIVEENVEATAAPEASAPAPEAVAVAAAAGPATTVALSESNFAFGKIKKGDKVEHVYEVTNTGTNPLVISEVKPACGCTFLIIQKNRFFRGRKVKLL